MKSYRLVFVASLVAVFAVALPPLAIAEFMIDEGQLHKKSAPVAPMTTSSELMVDADQSQKNSIPITPAPVVASSDIETPDYSSYETVLDAGDEPLLKIGDCTIISDGAGQDVPIGFALQMLLPEGWRVVSESADLMEGLRVSWSGKEPLEAVLKRATELRPQQWVIDCKNKTLALRKREKPVFNFGDSAELKTPNVKSKPDLLESSEFNIPFKPGSIAEIQDKSAFKRAVGYINRYSREGLYVDVVGRSISAQNHASERLADGRARKIKGMLSANGIHPRTVSTITRNGESYSESSAVIKVFVRKASEADSSPAAQPAEGAQVVAKKPVKRYDFVAGEDLEAALTRWVKSAGYNRLIWDVRDREGDLRLIPIVAGAAFDCDFLSCLSRVKEAYANAKPKPIYLQFDVKEGNRIVYVSSVL